MEKYLSIPQVAKMLGVSRMAIYKKVKARKIKAIKIGKNYAIPEEYIMGIIGKIVDKPLTKEDKLRIEKVLKKTIDEYSELLKLLGDE